MKDVSGASILSVGCAPTLSTTSAAAVASVRRRQLQAADAGGSATGDGTELTAQPLYSTMGGSRQPTRAIRVPPALMRHAPSRDDDGDTSRLCPFASKCFA